MVVLGLTSKRSPEQPLFGAYVVASEHWNPAEWGTTDRARARMRSAVARIID